MSERTDKMVLRLYFTFVCLTALLQLSSLCGASRASAETGPQAYRLETIVELALARNPLMSSAEGHIEQQRGQQTAAGAYPNPTVTGNIGYGEIRDAGRADIQGSLNRQSLTEYNVTVGQPLEWPSLRAARQQVAEGGLATATAGW